MPDEFDLHRLIAAPVIAMNDAQADAGASFYEQFEAFAFEEPQRRGGSGTPDKPRDLRKISFSTEIPDSDGRLVRRRVTMPLLQLVPIGGVGIEAATIRFSLAVSAHPPAGDEGSSPSVRRRALGTGREVVLKGRIPPTGGGSPSGNLDIEIQLRQMDLPAGYLDLIAATAGGTAEPEPDREVEQDDKGKGQEGGGGGGGSAETPALFDVNIDQVETRGDRTRVSIRVNPVPDTDVTLRFSAQPIGDFRVEPAEVHVTEEARLEVAIVRTRPLGAPFPAALDLDASAPGPAGAPRRTGHARLPLQLPEERS